MKKLTIFLILIIILIVCSFSCSTEGQAAGKYLKHVKNVYSIILKNSKNANIAASEVYDYVEKNQKEIEEASIKMKQLTAKETEKVYLPIVREIQKLGEYIKTHTTDEYPIGAEEKLGVAFQILFK